jgi:hypothetical protein
MIYESGEVNNVRNSITYNPEDLHPFIKYAYHDRPVFLKENNIKNQEFNIQR